MSDESQRLWDAATDPVWEIAELCEDSPLEFAAMKRRLVGLP